MLASSILLSLKAKVWLGIVEVVPMAYKDNREV
jgi:hypothetical protein